MSIERNKDGSITIEDNDSMVAISRITKLADDKWEEKLQKAMQEYAKLVTVCDHTIKETELYFLEQCDAMPIASNDWRMESFQLDVIITHFKDKLKHKASSFSFDMTDVEMEKWHKEESAMREEARKCSSEQFGLNIRGYYLPNTERNKVFYDQVNEKVREFMKNTNRDASKVEMESLEDICFFFEESTGHYRFNCGVCSLLYKVIIFMGISENDIEKHTQRFLVYINAMHEMGYLPNLL